MKILIAYSGGKDSQACLIWAVKKYKAENIEAVFCDTGWENPITYKHIKETCKSLHVKLTIVKSKKFDGLIDLAKQKKRFPSTKARFCTSELKSIPFIDYVLSLQDNVLVIQGIRAAESHSRSKMQKQCTFFKYYFEPFGHTKEGKPKFHTYRKKDIKEFVGKYAADIERPVFNWSGLQVVNYIIENGQKVNSLYYQGFKRVGCFPCIMSGHTEILQIIKRYPEQFSYIEKLEIEVGSCFFKLDSIPERFRSGIDKGKTFTRAIDLKKYLLDKNATIDMFEDESISCSSYYHLCE